MHPLVVSAVWDCIKTRGRAMGKRIKEMVLDCFSFKPLARSQKGTLSSHVVQADEDYTRALETEPWVEVKYICLNYPHCAANAPKRVWPDAIVTMRFETPAQSLSIRDYFPCGYTVLFHLALIWRYVEYYTLKHKLDCPRKRYQDIKGDSHLNWEKR